MTFPRIKLALVLFLLGLIGAVAVVPYAFTTVGVAQMQLSVPVENLMTLQVLLTVVLLFVAIPFGMAASGRVGIGAPYVARIVGAAVPALYVRTSSDGSRRAPGFGSFLLSVVLASAVGVIAAGLVVATDVLLFHTAIGAALATIGASIGIGLIGSSALQAIGRNPEAANHIQTPMVLSIAFTEAIAIYSLVVALIIKFV